MRIFAVDGIDASGKSSVVSALAVSTSARVLGEFSDTVIGDLIRNVLAHSDFFSIAAPSKMRLAETFLLAADLLAKIEALGTATSGIAIFDRGLLSLRAYQSVRVARDYDLETARDVEGALDAVFRSTRVAMMHVLLAVDEPTMIKRKRERGDPPVPTHEVESLMEMQRHMMACARARGDGIVDTSAVTLEAVVQDTLARFSSWVGPTA